MGSVGVHSLIVFSVGRCRLLILLAQLKEEGCVWEREDRFLLVFEAGTVFQQLWSED
jgi:hypothetical protein